MLGLYTGKTRNASEVLRRQESAVSADPAKRQALARMAMIAHQLKAELELGHIEALGETLHEGWMLKKSLTGEISSPQIDAWYEAARAAGAVGGKILGAGGGGFLLLFADPSAHEKIEQAQQRRLPEQIAYIPEETPALEGLGRVNRDLVQRCGERAPDQRLATVDQDATIIESHKQQALPTYEGVRGYQPMLAVWAETGLVLADQFRDGNVPAHMEPLAVAQRAFAALPGTVGEYYYRGDAACHESGLLNWLRDEQRSGGTRGRIGFAISARMSEPLHAAIEGLPEAAWETYGDPHPAEIRECADVPFVPSEKTEKKDLQPLRYVAIRMRHKQGELFEDGSAVRHFAVLSNRWELKPARLIEWHREKAGTIELVHDVIKNDLGGGVLPSKYFGANAAWLRLAVIAHNVLQALKRLALPAELLTARPKRLRFLLFNMPGRLVHHARRLILRVAAVGKWTAAYGDGLRLLPVIT